MTVARHTYAPREVGFFVEAALSPLSVSSVEWSDNGGVVEIYTTPDPLHTLRDIANWTKFSKPGGSGTFNLPAGTRKVAIEATSHVSADPSMITVVSDGVTNMEQARVYGIDQLDSPIVVVAPTFPGNVQPSFWYDFTDITQLFQDTGRTVAVTADGQSILGATDLGNGASDINGANGPTFRTGGLNGLSYAEFVAANSDCLTALGGVNVGIGSRTIMVVYRFENQAGTGQRYPLSGSGAGGTAQYSHNLNDFDPTYTPQTRINGATGNGNAIADQTIVAAIGEMIQSGGTDPFEYRFHYQAAAVTGNNTLTTGGTLGVNIGCDGVGANFFTGEVYEGAVWVNGVIPTLDDLETYITNKYGLVWV